MLDVNGIKLRKFSKCVSSITLSFSQYYYTIARPTFRCSARRRYHTFSNSFPFQHSKYLRYLIYIEYSWSVRISIDLG